jgi:hypothetical protein
MIREYIFISNQFLLSSQSSRSKLSQSAPLRSIYKVKLTSRAVLQEQAAYKPSQNYFAKSTPHSNLEHRNLSPLPNAIPRPNSERVNQTEIIAFVLLVAEPALRNKGFDIFPRWCIMPCRISVDADSDLLTNVSKNMRLLSREDIHLPGCGPRRSCSLRDS